MVAGMAHVMPWPAVNCGPTNNQAAPVPTLSCWFTVSNHKSPVELLVGEVELAVAAEIVLKTVPL